MAVNRVISFLVLSFVGAVLYAAPIELKVTGDRVNLRARPLADADVAGQVSSNETLFAPEGVVSGSEWVKVRPPQSVDLWIYAALVTDDAVNAADTYVRCGPGPQYKPVGKLQKGDRVERRGKASGDWLRIAPVDSAELFISSRYVTAVETEPPAENAASPEDRVAEQAQGHAQEPAGDEESAISSEIAMSAEPDADIGADDRTGSSDVIETAVARSDAGSAAQVPRVLAPYSLSASSCQGVDATLCGRLEKLPMPSLGGNVRYQLVERNGTSTSMAICRIIGLAGQWRELVGSDVEVHGRLWVLSGNPVPIIEAESAVRIASWEE